MKQKRLLISTGLVLLQIIVYYFSAQGGLLFDLVPAVVVLSVLSIVSIISIVISIKSIRERKLIICNTVCVFIGFVFIAVYIYSCLYIIALIAAFSAFSL